MICLVTYAYRLANQVGQLLGIQLTARRKRRVSTDSTVEIKHGLAMLGLISQRQELYVQT